MLIQQTIERLYQMRLTGMAAALEEQQTRSDVAELSFEDRLALVIEREMSFREDRRLTRLLQLAKLRLPAYVEDLDFRSPRGLDKSLVLRLATCGWIQEHEVVLIAGATGTGKSYPACALGHAACRNGLSVRYHRFSRLLGDLAIARGDGSYPKLLEKISGTELLILDDFGLAPPADGERRDLLEVLEDRYGRRATLMTSQLPLDHWHEVIGNPTFGDAILDRLVHHAHRMTLKGPSMRRKAYPATGEDEGATEGK